MSNLGDILNQPVCLPTTIPSDWSWIDLVDVSKPKQWKTISGAEMIPSGYPVFGANGFVGFYHEYNHEDESIAITCRGNTCGTINRIPPKTYITGNSMALDDVNERVVLKDFLYYALVYRQVTDSISGSAQPQITRDGLSKIQFPAPNIQEQQKIASILTAVDEVIASTTAQINKLKDLKTGMMQELLTKGIGHTEFKDSPVGRIPKGWEVKLLGDVCEFTQGVQITADNMVRESKAGYIRYMYIRDFTSDDRQWFVEDQYPNKIITDSDIAMANTGHSSGTVYKGKYGVLSNNAFKISFSKKVLNTDFLFYFLQSDFFLRTIQQLFNTAGQPHVGHGNIARMPTPIPPLNEQLMISTALSKVLENESKKLQKLNHLISLKKALMQDLLSGSVRVKLKD